jgi:predicted transcriptional regulator
VVDEEARFRCGAVVGILREEVWLDEVGNVARYNLAFIQHQLCQVDNGRVLGYDNAHGKHERHYMGKGRNLSFQELRATFRTLCRRSGSITQGGPHMKTRILADGFEGFRKRSLARAKKLDRGEPFEPEKIINFADPLDMMQVLTAERIRLCAVARKEAVSVSALAAKLKRDPKSVRRDVVTLERAGVLRTRLAPNPGHGRVRIVEPVAARFELRASF